MTDTRLIAAIFCEDIREERNGQVSLIGLFLDNVGVPAFPGMMPKLSVYARVMLPIEDPPPRELKLVLEPTWGREIPFGVVDESQIRRAYETARADNAPRYGLLMWGSLVPFPVQEAGILWAKIFVDGTEIRAGHLRFKLGQAEPVPVKRTQGQFPA